MEGKDFFVAATFCLFCGEVVQVYRYELLGVETKVANPT